MILIGSLESPLISGALLSAKTYDIPHEVLDVRKIRERFGGVFQPNEEEIGLCEPDGGVLFPEKIIETYVNLARNENAEFHFNEPLIKWKLTSNGGFKVTTSKESYSSNKIIFTPGAWLPFLVPELNLPLKFERQVVFWFRPTCGTYTPSTFPIFAWELKDDATYYGIPDFGEGVKVARHHGGEIVDDPNDVGREVKAEDEFQVRDFLKDHIPSLDTTPSSSTTCIYTDTPDSHFIVDLYPKNRNVVIVSACSGHGFKFASVIGEIVAELLTNGNTRHDISLFKLSRFAS